MVSLRFPGRFGPVEIYKVRQAVKSACEESGLTPEATYSFVSAVDELCCNVMEHSKAKWFGIELQMEKGSLEARLSDDGVEFDPTDIIDQQDSKEVFENATDRKLGLSMVGLMVDAINHSRDTDGINHVVLTKNLG